MALFAPAALAVMLPVASLVIPSQLILRKLAGVAHNTYSPPVTSCSPSIPPSPSPGTPLSILTYNIAGLSTHVNINPPVARLREFFVRLAAAPNSPDVVAFQESFSPTVSALIKEHLSAAYPHMLLDAISIPPTLPGWGPILSMNSGLVVVSKHPIKFAQARAFTGSCGADYHSNKGCVAVGIEAPGSGATIIVYTSHTQSDPTMDPLWWFDFSTFPSPARKAAEVKESQIRELGAFVATIQAAHPGCPGFLVGDLNVVGEELSPPDADSHVVAAQTNKHRQMMEMLREACPGIELEDCFRAAHPLSPDSMPLDEVGVTFSGSGNADCDLGCFQRLDYAISVSPSGGGKAADVEDIRVLDMRWDEVPLEDELDGKVGRSGERVKCFSDHAALLLKAKY
ncbi:hypothetical protein TeGR_g13989 [Tetraparma gracilis]|uniref:Endonuclease/exonuclease/phosphatase domain-containing protein n=1 Tax=Tetraparma gracilis TaxID=2962635 RepID=A0ABQ6ML45_9STRA|nr:hypothetical protein TeGR_g13989 [Tetraparma gracilis]